MSGHVKGDVETWPDTELVDWFLAPATGRGLSPEKTAKLLRDLHMLEVASKTIGRWKEAREANRPLVLTAEKRELLAALRRRVSGHDWTRPRSALSIDARAVGYIDGLTRAADAMRIVILGIEAEARRVRCGMSPGRSATELADAPEEDEIEEPMEGLEEPE